MNIILRLAPGNCPGGFKMKVVVGDGFEPSKALADRFTVCTL
jgi:hypothetical protein